MESRTAGAGPHHEAKPASNRPWPCSRRAPSGPCRDKPALRSARPALEDDLEIPPRSACAFPTTGRARIRRRQCEPASRHAAQRECCRQQPKEKARRGTRRAFELQPITRPARQGTSVRLLWSLALRAAAPAPEAAGKDDCGGRSASPHWRSAPDAAPGHEGHHAFAAHPCPDRARGASARWNPSIPR